LSASCPLGARQVMSPDVQLTHGPERERLGERERELYSEIRSITRERERERERGRDRANCEAMRRGGTGLSSASHEREGERARERESERRGQGGREGRREGGSAVLQSRKSAQPSRRCGEPYHGHPRSRTPEPGTKEM